MTAMHDHHHHGGGTTGDSPLTAAVAVNLILTVAQVIGGIVAGSLSLIADALHNLSDAASLAIALFARRVGRRPPSVLKTFGYKRAELIAALINLTTLIIIGLYLIYEAFWRFFQPQEVEGWIVVAVAGVALVINVATAILTYRLSRESINVRAAFLHNVSDALSSVGVMIAGALIILYQWYWMDALITLMIAGYVLHQASTLLPQTVHILMEGTPEHLSIDDVIREIMNLGQVEGVHHVHVWQLDEHRNALEAHVVVHEHNLADIEAIKRRIKSRLHDRFRIEHSTLEIELDTPTREECTGEGCDTPGSTADEPRGAVADRG